MTLRELCSGLVEESAWRAAADVVLTHVTMDSREVREGSVFVCLKGFQTDGHRFAAEAVKRGAVAVVAQEDLKVPVPVVRVPDTTALLSPLAARYYGSPSNRLRMIGVTGTNGKTTTTYLLEAILRRAGRMPGVIGTIEYRLGSQAVPASHTTPQALTLQRTLAEMAQQGATHVVMEVSSHALALGRVEDCEFDGAVFTNLTQDHLDFHGTMEAYGQAKKTLFDHLTRRPRKPVEAKYAVLNADDPFSAVLGEGLTVPVWTYGISHAAKVKAENVQSSREGIRARVTTPFGPWPFRMTLRGRHNVENGLAALTAALAEGIEPGVALEALAECRGAPGRLEWIDEGQPYMVVVDYAHTPDALKKTLETVKEFHPRRIVTVFGCGGDRDRRKRPLMGAIAAQLSTHVVVTSDNPRSEDPESIVAEVVGGVKSVAGAAWSQEVDRRKAILQALELAGPEDLVLIAGKGHETYQIVGRQILPFDDREVAREAVRRRSAAGPGRETNGR